MGVCTICLTDSEFSTYFGLIFQCSLSLDLYFSGQFSSVIKSPHNNLSAQLNSNRLEVISASLVLSEVSIYFSTYFGHNFPHRLQLEFNSSCQIILGIDRRHINLSRKFFLVDSSACWIDSDFRTYFGQNLSHILKLGFNFIFNFNIRTRRN